MKIGNISNNTSFRNIYGVVGNKKDMTKLRLLVADAKKTTDNPAMVYNVTEQPNIQTSFNDLGNRQFFMVVTGEDSLKTTSNLAGTKLSSFLIDTADKIINIGSNVVDDAKEILESIKHNQ